MSILLPAYEGLRKERVLASAQLDRGTGRFRNAADATEPRVPLGTILEFFQGGRARTPESPLPVDDPRPGLAAPVEDLRVTWLGHSSVLLELPARPRPLRVLLDPVFGERASPVPFAGPARFHPVPLHPAAIPVDVILLSHDHYDHLCADTLRTLAARGLPIVTALGVGARLEGLGFPPGKITELDWGEKAPFFGGALALEAHPCQHFSGRGAGDRNKTLWASWIVRTDRHAVYFSGDTGLFDGLAPLAAHGPFDLVLLEVGAFHPSWGTIHLGPDGALEAQERLGGAPLLPVHWATFDLGLHPWKEPGDVLHRRAAAEGRPVLFPRIGEVFTPTRRLQGPQPAWWRSAR